MRLLCLQLVDFVSSITKFICFVYQIMSKTFSNFWGRSVILTLRRTLILVIPHHQQFSQAGHLGDFCDDPEETLDAIIGQDHCCEARCPWGDQWQEKGAVYTGPLLQETKDWENTNCLACKHHTLFVFPLP